MKIGKIRQCIIKYRQYGIGTTFVEGFVSWWLVALYIFFIIGILLISLFLLFQVVVAFKALSMGRCREVFRVSDRNVCRTERAPCVILQDLPSFGRNKMCRVDCRIGTWFTPLARLGLTSRDQDIKLDCRINFCASPHERLGNRLPKIYSQNFPLVTLTEHTPRITISQIKEPVAISSSTINYMKLVWKIHVSMSAYLSLSLSYVRVMLISLVIK